jgi:hypothetical protein
MVVGVTSTFTLPTVGQNCVQLHPNGPLTCTTPGIPDNQNQNQGPSLAPPQGPPAANLALRLPADRAKISPQALVFGKRYGSRHLVCVEI